MTWILRLARWTRHPPSPGKAKLVVGVVVARLVLVGIERVWDWPDWLTVNRIGHGYRLRP